MSCSAGRLDAYQLRPRHLPPLMPRKITRLVTENWAFLNSLSTAGPQTSAQDFL
jgi:hypothetical protein